MKYKDIKRTNIVSRNSTLSGYDYLSPSGWTFNQEEKLWSLDDGNGSAPPPPLPPHLGIRGKICDPKPTASVVDPNDPETWGEYTGIHPHPNPLHFMGNTSATWNILYTPQVGDFIVSPRRWLPPPGGALALRYYQGMSLQQKANVLSRDTVWEVTSLYPQTTQPVFGTRRLVSNCIQGLSWICHPATATTPKWCSQHPPGVGPFQFEAPCLADPLCITIIIPDSYFCSGASGIGHPNGTLWACYDPQDGTGTYSVLGNCIAACQPPPPVSWACSGPNGITLPAPIGTVPMWTCYDPGDGTGQHSNQGACQAVCIEPTWDCDMANHTCNLHPTGGGFYNSTNGGYQACIVACVPPESWNCDLPLTAAFGTCTDPGDGSGQYMTWQLCNDVCNQQQHVVLEEPEKSWNCEWHWTTYSQGGPNLVGNCNPILGTSGTYAIEQDCLDACREYQAFIDDGPLATDPCELCCCESTPNPPWTCIPGTQVMAAGNLNPCNCAEMGMIDCTEDVGMGQDGYDCLPDGTCTYVWGNPTYTGANAALNLSPAGINYPNSLAGALAYCEDSCLPVIGGTLCPRIRSCPCGWSHGPSTIPGGIDCTDPTGASTMLAIEKCMEFPMPNYAPAIGDAWLNSGSYSNITWNRAIVVDITGTITTTITQEIRSTCN